MGLLLDCFKNWYRSENNVPLLPPPSRLRNWTYLTKLKKREFVAEMQDFRNRQVVERYVFLNDFGLTLRKKHVHEGEG